MKTSNQNDNGKAQPDPGVWPFASIATAAGWRPYDGPAVEQSSNLKFGHLHAACESSVAHASGSG